MPTTLALNPVHVGEYFSTARERHRILLARRAGFPKPWTTDPAMSRWRFCNVFREDDVTTIWVRKHVREPMHDDPRCIVAMTACRYFNKISTLEILNEEGLLESWNSDKAKKLLRQVSPLVGAGYLIKTPDGLNKLDGVCQIVNQIQDDLPRLAACVKKDPRLEAFWAQLRHYPFLGPFMSYEIVSDLRHTAMLEHASDIMGWANAGPGACAGMSWLTGGDLKCVPYTSSKQWATATLNAMRELLELSRQEEYWPQHRNQWEMREVEHWLCEYAKWVKVCRLEQRMKRKYP